MPHTAEQCKNINKAYRYFDKFFLVTGISSLLLLGVSTAVYILNIADYQALHILIFSSIITTATLLAISAGNSLLKKQDIQFENQYYKFISGPSMGILFSFALSGMIQGATIGILYSFNDLNIQLYSFIEKCSINILDNIEVNVAIFFAINIIVSSCVLIYQAAIPNQDSNQNMDTSSKHYHC